MSAPEHIVIIGSGVIGLCSAYYLAHDSALPPSSTITVVENSRGGSIAPGASRWSGGFIAGGAKSDDWVGPPSFDLARLSWACHHQMSDALGGKAAYGFRPITSTGLRTGSENASRSAYRALPQGVAAAARKSEWLVGDREDLTGNGGLAQLNPGEFCDVLHQHLTSLSSFRTIFGDVRSLAGQGSSRTIKVQLHGHSITHSLPCTKLLVAAGPWSAAVCETLRLPPITLTNLPGHSLLIRPALAAVGLGPRGALPTEAVFAGIGETAEMGVHAATSGLARQLREEEIALGFTAAPELFSRSNGLVYVAGENTMPVTAYEGQDIGRLPNRLPDTVDSVKYLTDKRLSNRLKIAAAAVSPALREENGAVIVHEGFCYRPKTYDGEAMIGQLAPGVFLATGHGPWGITLAPGTGKIVSEIVLAPAGTTPKLSADISQLGIREFDIKAKL